MQIFHGIKEFKRWRQGQQGSIAFVPTMGNLHSGHVALIKKAKTIANTVVVSIFVNPLQFAPHEDYQRYPRTLDQDQQQLQTLGIDVLFAPNAVEMYPHGQDAQTQITVPGLSDRLCGLSRPHFFNGVATVVMKCFHLVKPQYAIFGEKDFQQLLIIKKCVADFNLDIEIVGHPIIRDADGLAMSSRNQYLTSEQRKQAPLLHRQCQQMAEQITQGQKNFNALSKQSIQDLTTQGFNMDYFQVCRQQDLLPAIVEDQRLIIMAAGYLGQTRLIDNLQVNLI